MVPTAFGALLSAAVGPFAASCSRAEDERAHSALLITLDTTRADALSSNGAPAGLTPHLDALAREGLVFDRAYTVAPLTLPAHASMLTGLYPIRHGVRSNGIHRLDEAVPVLAERAGAAGVQTAAFLGSIVLDDAFGLGRGFETYEVPPHSAKAKTTAYPERTGLEVVARAIAWLEGRDRSRPFLLWVHLWDPHGPYEAPPGFEDRSEDPYLREVAAADEAVGRLVEALRADGAWDETVTLVVADHGEAFEEHGEISHGVYCYDTTLRVPLILRLPGSERAGERSDRVVSVADVAPTLAHVLALPPLSADLDGQSLLADLPADRGVYFESYYGYLSYGWSPLSGWVDDGGKYLHSSEPQFFDLERDAGEEHDLFAEGAARFDPYRARLREVASRPRHSASSEGVDAEARGHMAGLGYAAFSESGEGLPDPLETGELPSPASRVEEQRMTMSAQAHMNAGHWEEARRLHEAILRDNPDNLHSLEGLGACLINLGRDEEALEPLRRVLATGRGSEVVALDLSIALTNLGRRAEAEEACDLALEMNPRSAAALRAKILLLRSDGRDAEALPFKKRLRALTRDS